MLAQSIIKDAPGSCFECSLSWGVKSTQKPSQSWLQIKSAYPSQCRAFSRPFSLWQTSPASATAKSSSPDVGVGFHCCVRQIAAPRPALRASNSPCFESYDVDGLRALFHRDVFLMLTAFRRTSWAPVSSPAWVTWFAQPPPDKSGSMWTPSQAAEGRTRSSTRTPSSRGALWTCTWTRAWARDERVARKRLQGSWWRSSKSTRQRSARRRDFSSSSWDTKTGRWWPNICRAKSRTSWESRRCWTERRASATCRTSRCRRTKCSAGPHRARRTA